MTRLGRMTLSEAVAHVLTMLFVIACLVLASCDEPFDPNAWRWTTATVCELTVGDSRGLVCRVMRCQVRGWGRAGTEHRDCQPVS